MCEDSCQLLCTHLEHLWVDVLWSPGLIGPGPSKLLSHLVDLDCNWRFGGGVTVLLGRVEVAAEPRS